ncbi:MAG: hypothetical protein A2Y67_03805 [Candidatus Buchananbacteria bacterium RBG_13_39_9]|uniref:Peptidoglycan recognition protein family domain-containing protein n=1 Tax=Candidatus Buchananbacteria bacterium RBG_13_39_9 TaxID=1797531 RepID=A0A1G1XT86_9BACT|nr:MAG: hypothetical protein A2Y67_03805 [Candidatus Buchananbacteria bacterium RBG_13_39_9]
MKYRIKTKLVLSLVIFWSVALAIFLAAAKSDNEIKAGQITINDPQNPGSFFISANISKENAKTNQNDYVSPVLRADFPFNALFVKWQSENTSPNNSDFELYLRFLNENWSPWQKIMLDDDYQGKDTNPGQISSQMIAVKLTDSFQYKLVLANGQPKTNLKNLQFIYLDTTKGPKNNFTISLQNKDNGLKIISRAEWGADESLRYDPQSGNLWPEEYFTPKKFVLHHTAGENANADPKATIRAIYYFHAKIRSWGDIGYNYLIDSQGNIYEGRFGGEGIVAGHAYLRNRNTIGIAILGCYQNEKNSQNNSNCNSPDNLTEATKISLNKLIAAKSREFNIDPLGQSEFHGQILPNVIGHKDVGNTSCPGNLIYESLPASRQLAYNLLVEMGGYKKPLASSAEFVSLSSQEIKIEETKSAEITVQYKNIGQETWRGYEDNYLYVTDSEIKNKIAKINSVAIAMSDKDETPKQTENFPVFKLQGGNVYPGETGTFKLTLNAPLKETETKKFILAWQNKGYFPDSDFALTLKKIACNCGQNNNTGQADYKALLTSSTFPSQMTAASSQDIALIFKNDGNRDWQKDKLQLKITYANNQISPFRNDSWYSVYADIPPAESVISLAAQATFNFKLKAPDVLAAFPHTITLLYDGQKIYEYSQVIDVLSAYQAEIIVNTLPLSAKRNSRPKVKITFKNTGSKTWTNVILKSTDIDGTNSWFRDWSWLDKKTIKQINKTVKPGEEITFEFRLLAYWKPNKYPHVYKLFNGQNQIYLDAKKELLTYTQVTK